MGAPLEGLSWFQFGDDETLIVSVSTAIYSLDALFRTCYLFTDKCYLFLESEESERGIRVSIAKKKNDTNLRNIAGEFCNELIDQRLRRQIASETKPIRELIVAQAFTEAGLSDQSLGESNYVDDPKGISK